MKILIGALIGTMLAASAPALAAGDEAERDSAKEKKVCKSYKVTGSLTRVQRICRTEAEWRLAVEKTKAGVDELQGSGGGGTAIADNPGAGG